jgi:tRNA A37 threonylcarbamoyladenosine synthetase subunit TsaC/SUA5/YrdC
VTDRNGEELNDPDLIESEWRHEIAVILDSGVLPQEHSTIVDLTDSNSPVVVREGKGDSSLVG